LAEEIAHTVRCESAVLDCEIACIRPDGSPHFYRLLFRRDWPYFFAFDLLFLNGQDLRGLPLLERRRRLRAITPKVESRVLYLDHVPERGRDLFRVVCDRDLEGIVAKYANGKYQSDGRSTSWLKIKHAGYSQMEGRQELFEQRMMGAPRRCTRSIRPELRSCSYRWRWRWRSFRRVASSCFSETPYLHETSGGPVPSSIRIVAGCAASYTRAART
jgi:ATP-dependent DNA ligase